MTAGWDCGGLSVMDDEVQEISRLVNAVLARFFAQNAKPALPAAAGAAFGARLGRVVAERGRAKALTTHEPGGMTEAECAPLVARVLDDAPDPLLVAAAKQL